VKPHKNGKKLVLLITIPLLVVALFLTAVVLFSSIPGDVYTNTDEISETINNLQPRVLGLNNISVLAQPDATSCGITTVAVASNYFNNTSYTINDYIKKYAIGSSSGGNMTDWLQHEMPNKTVTYKDGVTAGELIRDIHVSLSNGNPVVIMFGAENPYNEPYYDFHASVVYGLNLNNESIIIANSYGYSEEISLIDFLNKMSYTEISKYPLFQKISIRFFQPKNAYFLVE
jgi:hypothetical protein